MISGSEDTIAKEGIDLIVTGPRGQSLKWERALHLMWLSNDEETLILRGIEYESETADEGSGASLKLPLHLRRMLEISDAANSVWLTKKKASRSRISFTTKPDPNLSIEIFKDQKLRGRSRRSTSRYTLPRKRSPLRRPSENTTSTAKRRTKQVSE